MVSFTIVMTWMTLSIFVNPFGLQTVPFNASEAMIVLSPMLALYFGRRHTETGAETARGKKPKEDDGESDA